MSAAYNRGSRKIMYDINSETQKREEILLQRSLDRWTHDANKKIQELEQKNSELEKKVFEAQVKLETYKEQAEHAKNELAMLSQSRNYYKELFEASVSKYNDLNRAHQKLSEIVRFAVSPEKYHFWREEVEELYPELSKQD